jgi:hypothetical protein
MITHCTDGLSRGIWANGLNTDLKSFTVEVFIPAFTPLSLTKWSLNRIGVYGYYAPLWNVETDTSSWEPHHLMHTNTLWVFSPGVARQGFTAAIVAWVESQWESSSHLFLVLIIQQRSFGRVNKNVEFIGQFKEVPSVRAHSPLAPLTLYYPPPLCTFSET